MVSINNALPAMTAPVTVVKVSTQNDIPGTPPPDGLDKVRAPELSLLSRQLSESAERAAIRDKTLSREALGDLARGLVAQLVSEPYSHGDVAGLVKRDIAEGLELWERDIQAVRYLVNEVQGRTGIQSPFASLGREQLVLIAYDDSGAFTLNERHAAWREAYDHEQRFREGTISRGQAGAFDEQPYLYYAEILDHYRSLPLIEQAQYPDDYEARVEHWMYEEAGLKSITDDRLLTLFEILAGKIPGQDDKKKEKDDKQAAVDSTVAPSATGNEPAGPLKTSS